MNFLVKKSLSILILLVTFFTAQSATTYTWTGSSSIAWETPGNWTVNGTIPTTTPGNASSDIVVISTCSTNMPQLNSTVTIANFTMSACTLSINSGFTLNITGTTSITGTSTTIEGEGTISISNANVTITNASISDITTITGSGSDNIIFTDATFTNTVTATGNIMLSGSLFTGISTFTYTGAGGSSNASSGGNVFKNTVNFNSQCQSYAWYLSNSTSDIFTGPVIYTNNNGGFQISNASGAGNTYNSNVTFNQGGTWGNIYPAYMGGTEYNGSLTFSSSNTNTNTIVLGSGGGSSSISANNSLSISGTFSEGGLQFNNFTQWGNTTSQSLTMSGTATLNFTSCTFQGPLTANAPILTFKENNFENSVNFTTTASNASSTSYGGNAFGGSAVLTNSSANGNFIISNTSPDVFSSGLSLINNSEYSCIIAVMGNTYTGAVTLSNYSSAGGYIAMGSNASATSTYNGSISLNCTGTGGIYFGSNNGVNGGASVLNSGYTISATGGTWTRGSLNLKYFTQSGSTAQALDFLAGGLSMSHCSWGGNFESTALTHNVGSTTFYGAASFTETGSSGSYWAGGNIFIGATSFTNQMTSNYMYLSYTSPDVFYSTVSFINQSAPGIYINYYTSAGAGNTYTGDVTLINTSSSSSMLGISYNTSTTSTFSGNIYLTNSSVGTISFGGNNGESVLAAGKTIYTTNTSGTVTTAGTVTFKNFIQSDASTPQTLTISGSTATLNIINSTFAGVLNVSSPLIFLQGSVFQNPVTLTKTGTGSSTISNGGNTFDSPVTVDITGGAAGYADNLGYTSGDIYKSTLNISNSTASTVFMNYGCAAGTGDIYYGTVTYTNNGTGTQFFYPSYNGTAQYYGNISASLTGSAQIGVVFGNGSGVTEFGGSNQQYISGSAGYYGVFFNKLTMNKTSGSLTLSLPVNTGWANNGGIITLNGGTIITTSTNKLTFNLYASVIGGSNNSFINGPVTKVGSAAFTFPVGAGTTYAPVSMTAATESSSEVTAQYFNTAPSGTTPSGYTLSACQYWNLTRNSGSSGIKFTFGWNPESCDRITIPLLSLANSTNGTSWAAVPSSATGENSVGTVTTGNFFTTALGYFTFAFSPGGNCPSDITENWVEEIHYDENNNVISDTRMYADGMGRTLQSQTINQETNQVIAAATIYDTYGRPAIQTLPGAINNTCFSFNSTFVTNSSGNPYSYKDFDIAINNVNNVNTPLPVSAACSLGTYYSASNPEMVATSSYPYSRVFYNDAVPGGMIRAASAGESLIMGSGHERKAIVLPLLSELDGNYLALRNSYFMQADDVITFQNQGVKTLVFDENGNGTVTLKSKEGQVLATAITNSATSNTHSVSIGAAYFYYNYPLGPFTYINPVINGTATSSGTTSPSSYTQIRSNAPFTVTYAGQGENDPAPTFPTTYYPSKAPGNSSVDFYCSSSSFSIISNSGNSATDYITITDLTTGNIVYNNGTVQNFSSSSLTFPGYYRIALTSTAYTDTYLSNELTVSYTDNFTNWAYYFYDDAGHMVAQTAPNGVNNITSTAVQPSFTTTYTYDTRGRVLSKTDPDRGTTQYLYRQDGSLRFSQNSFQASTGNGAGRFAFINYDAAVRPVATGEYYDNSNSTWQFENQVTADQSTNSNGVHNLLTPGTDATLMSAYSGAGSNYCINVLYSNYDVVDNTCPRSQTFVDGMVSSTSKKNKDSDPSSAIVSKTWYSYDEFGRIGWTVQNVNGLSGSKTIDYTYGLNSNLLTAAYQQATTTEQFTHQYMYDRNMQVELVNTSQGSNGFAEQAEYYYYNHGALKRTELGGTMQGIDYTYTVNGWLKAINNPTMTADPGGDGIAGSAHSNFQKDAFGMTLEYYDSDYLRTGTSFQTTTNLGTTYPNQYNGNIRSSVWTNQGTAQTMSQFAYTYDNQSQLLSAIYGTNNGSQSFTASATNAYLTNNISYDLNGNLLTLTRNNNNGTPQVKDNMQYNYLLNGQSAPTFNRLQTTIYPGTGQASRTYTYDAIGRITSMVPSGTGETTKYFCYDVFNHVTGVYASAGTSQPIVTYTYDDRGHRLQKINYNQTTYQPVTTTYYVRDAAGTTVSIYNNSTGTMQQEELPIYGKGRVGNITIGGSTVSYDYEITDHLGNMRTTVSVVNGAFQTVSYADYYPHGGVLPGANGNLQMYRYQYQGQYAEADAETGYNSFDLRMYDPTTVTMIGPDPMEQDWSPYMAMGNNHVNSIDPSGGTWVSHAENWAINVNNHFTGWEEQHPELIKVEDDVALVAAVVAVAVVTMGVGDMVLAPALAGWGMAAAGAEDVATMAAFTVTGAFAGGGQAMAIDGDKFGSGAFWAGVGIGAVSGLAGGAGDVLGDAEFLGGDFDDLATADKTMGNSILYGARNGAISGAFSGFTDGFLTGVAQGRHDFIQDMEMGLTKGALGLGFGAAAGAGSGLLRGISIENGSYFANQKIKEYNMRGVRAGRFGVIQNASRGALSLGRVLNIGLYDGNIGGMFADKFVDFGGDIFGKNLEDYLNLNWWGIQPDDK